MLIAPSHKFLVAAIAELVIASAHTAPRIASTWRVATLFAKWHRTAAAWRGMLSALMQRELLQPAVVVHQPHISMRFASMSQQLVATSMSMLKLRLPQEQVLMGSR